ncbi:hypothetical protein BHD05_12680 [Marisediminicola antarctica]|uniref:Uncharacterized protein n=2 Tax=Marisediminicola antarctica TaxID=674079 RepID=A0A7L5AIH2_9MICO|nr:hypothetical protein BHD05_12680 [Marisediminicola antarctica]
MVAVLAVSLAAVTDSADRSFADSLSGSSAVSVVVANSTTGVVKEGLGWNAENVWQSENKIDGGINWGTTQWDQYNNMVKFLNPQVVRLGVQVPYWSPSYGTYTWNSSWMQNLYQQLDAYKAAGVTVMLSNWWTSSNYPDNFWWSETSRNGTTDPDSFKRNDLPYDNAKFSEALVAGIKHLTVTKGYTNIKYLSAWNEPDWNFVSANASYPASATSGSNTFWPLYTSIGNALTTAGIRSQVSIVGPETSWIERFGPNIKTYVKTPAAGQPQQFGQVVDAIAVHDYDSFSDHDTRTYDNARDYFTATSTIGRVADIKTSVNATYAAAGKPAPPMFVAECCNTAYGAAYINDASAVTDDGLFSAEMSARYLSSGVDGVMRWNLTTTSQGGLPYETGFVPITYDFPSQTFSAQGGSYYSAAILSRYLSKGASVHSTTVTGAGSPARVFATALKRADGNWTIYLVNNDYTDRQADLDLSALGIPTSTPLYQYEWSSGNPNGILAKQALTYQGRTFNLPLAPRSVSTFTTLGSDFTPQSMLTVNQATGGVTATSVAAPVANSGFETGSSSGWTTTGSVTVQNSPVWANAGSYVGTLNSSVGAAELAQTLTGLSAGSYVLSAHIRTAGTNTATIGVKNFDGTKNYSQDVTSSVYRSASVYFTVPTGGGSATVYVKVPAGSSGTFVNLDDVRVVRIANLANGGFENASPFYWTASGSASRQAVTSARSGGVVGTISTSTGAGSFSQTVNGLAPGRYSFSGFVRGSAGITSSISVSGYGGATVTASGTSSSWQRVSVPFTVTTANSTATVTYSAPAGSAGSYSNGDDFEVKRNPSPQPNYTDLLADFSKMSSHSANLAFDGANSEFLGYNSHRLVRSSNTAAYVAYTVPSGTTMKGFVVSSYFWPGEAIANFQFATSPDGVTYTPIAPTQTAVPDPIGTNWTVVGYTNSTVPAGTKFLKITFANTTANYWNPQLSSVQIFH